MDKQGNEQTLNDGSAKPAIYRARSIVTMTQTPAEAFAVVGEQIVAVGKVDDLRTRFPEAELVDFGDAHMHLGMTAEDLLHVDLSYESVSSLAQLKAKLREEALRRPPGTWIRGTRYDDAKMAEGRVLTRWDLDEVSREHPILVIHVAGHWAVVNTKALEMGGITENTAAPPGGRFGKDASGRLNGILYEQALFDFAYPAASKTGRTVAPASTFEERLGGLARAVEMFHAAGLTSVTDALVGPQELALFQEG